ncbi:hypothetical protein A2U01_0058158 [Trifolium medium]|uniref:Uncharacterized protein n=1 Tax=Trifolium medium TaxID=97028 RepID=A0A392RLH7_9FABA|nr:hypothetical protein [Trifolium medium]
MNGVEGRTTHRGNTDVGEQNRTRFKQQPAKQDQNQALRSNLHVTKNTPEEHHLSCRSKRPDADDVDWRQPLYTLQAHRGIGWCRSEAAQ